MSTSLSRSARPNPSKSITVSVMLVLFAFAATSCAAAVSSKPGFNGSPNPGVNGSPAPGANGSPTPVARPQVGISSHVMWDDDAAARNLLLSRLRASGAEWIRIDIDWSALETSPGVYAAWYVARLDSVVDNARAQGFSVLGVLMGTPTWANGGASIATPPSDPARYGSMAHWVAARYAGRVAAWEIWNEPNMERFMVGTDPATYVGLLRAAYPQIKSANASATVVMGALGSNDVDWLRAAYRAGAAGYFDVVSTHPYAGPSDAPPEAESGTHHNISGVRPIRALMAAEGDAAKPIWFTEIGWSTFLSSPTASTRGVSESVQATYVTRALQLIAADYPYVEKVFWYMDVDRSDNTEYQNNLGLLRVDLSPKPAVQALRDYLSG